MSLQGSTATEADLVSNGHNPMSADLLKKKLANMRVMNGNSCSVENGAECPRTTKTPGKLLKFHSLSSLQAAQYHLT